MRVPDWGLPRVKRGTGGCNPTILDAEGVIGYIVKQAKRVQRREAWVKQWGEPAAPAALAAEKSVPRAAHGGIRGVCPIAFLVFILSLQLA